MASIGFGECIWREVGLHNSTRGVGSPCTLPTPTRTCVSFYTLDYYFIFFFIFHV